MFCESINASERVGRAQVFEMNEAKKTNGFGDVLPESEDIPTALPEALATHPISVYRAPADASDDSDDEITDPVKNVVSSGEKLKRGLLKTDGCFVIDVGCEVFLWIGLGARPEVKVAAGEIMARVIRLVDRPPWLALQRAIEGHEPEAFKLRFPDWADSDPARKLLLRPERQQPALPGIEVDVQALYTAKNSFGSLGNIASEESTIEETFKKANQQLVSMTLFMHDKSGRFIRVPAQEQEHVWNGDAYLFLCVYSKKPVEGRISASRRSEIQKQGSEGSVSIVESMDDCSVNGSELESEDGESSDVMTESAYDDTEDLANEMDEVDCIVYFWEGRKASRVAYSAFRFQALSEMENLVRNMYGCGVSVVHTVQGREPVELLAHLGNRIVVYRGNRKTDRWRLRAAPDSASMPPSQGSHVSPAADSHDKVLHPDKPMHFHQTILFHIRTEGSGEQQELSNSLCKDPMTFPLRFFGLVVAQDAMTYETQKTYPIVSSPSSTLKNLSLTSPSHTNPYQKHPYARQVVSALSLRNSNPRHFGNALLMVIFVFSSAALMSPISPTPSIASANSAITPRSESATGHALRSTAITGILPRLLLCTCSSGNFRVIEIADFVQTDLDTTTCAIVDPGPPDHVFVWCGLEASDVVRTLTRKAVEIWVRETNRGDGEGELECVEWVEEGEEGAAFRTVFLGWEVGGADAGKRVKDPGNRFKREEELRKSKTSKAGTTTVTA
ncbi:hypothetical protein BC829DRAFT_435064 [Chytridium lagenaria]|nr:hypothetical protein BC829DRAFT_435064 [Chytridium lagenaria]